MAAQKAHIPQAIEDYLVAIYVLEREGLTVISARVAEHVGVSPVTMHEMVRRLMHSGYLTVDRKKRLRLTPEGRRVAESVYRRHTLAERLMTDVLGLDWAQAHREAHRFEHVITPLVEERLIELLKHPQTCPHGNPIPGMYVPLVEESVPLSTVAEGSMVEMARISEEAERDSQLLGYLDVHGVRPGAWMRVTQVAPWVGTLMLRRDDDEFPLGLQIAAKIYVRPLDPPDKS
ncbi:MAG: metal-dependent transcriptional regulator [Nitrospinae bacterium]|nr:metal-dependent transcriptional regulator [Nitrospinota bacterium]